MDYNRIIGSNIRFERQKRELTIDELSEILDIAPGFLGLIERGKRGTSIKNLCKIADVFNITLDTLITCQLSETSLVREESEIEEKRRTALSYIHSMDNTELDYFISCMKGFKKYVASQKMSDLSEDSSDFSDSIDLSDDSPEYFI